MSLQPRHGRHASPGAFALMYLHVAVHSARVDGWPWVGGDSQTQSYEVLLCVFLKRNLNIYIFTIKIFSFFYKIELDFMFYMKPLPKTKKMYK